MTRPPTARTARRADGAATRTPAGRGVGQARGLLPAPGQARGLAPAADDDACGRGRGRPRDERASAAITAAARHQLETVGYAGISMESVAAEAGVSRATVYRRYQDKADLVTAAIAAAVDPPPGGPSRDPRGDLVRYLVRFDSRFAEHCLEVLGGLLGAREDPHAMALHRQRVITPRTGYVRHLLVRARELGQLGPEADVDLAVQMLVGAVLARRAIGVDGDRGWARRAVDAVWRGMAPGPS